MSRGRLARWWRRAQCVHHGHVWAMPPTTHHFNECIHLPCRRCDAWRTVHAVDCPDGYHSQTTRKHVTP